MTPVPVAHEGERHPLKDTRATQMLAAGLRRLSESKGISQRELAPRLGYKQAVVLSHMATGRVPIPIERALELARAIDVDEAEFLRAVLDQRHPEINWNMLYYVNEDAAVSPTGRIVGDIEAAAGQPLWLLSQEQLAVIKEAAADPHPRRRWIAVLEIAAMETIRKAQPHIGILGLNPDELALLSHKLA